MFQKEGEEGREERVRERVREREKERERVGESGKNSSTDKRQKRPWQLQ